MALLFECTPQCARKLLDTADIVREAIFHQLHRWHAASAFRNVAIAVKNNKLFIHKRPAEFIKRRADAPTLRRVI